MSEHVVSTVPLPEFAIWPKIGSERLLSAFDLESACRIVEGTARSMGITVEE